MQNEKSPKKPDEEILTETTETIESESKEKIDDAICVGCVINCDRLRIRDMPFPHAKIVTTVSAGIELTIDMRKSTAEYYRVSTNDGCNGFCIREYIQVGKTGRK